VGHLCHPYLLGHRRVHVMLKREGWDINTSIEVYLAHFAKAGQGFR
jgi:hypothetical protein